MDFYFLSRVCSQQGDSTLFTYSPLPLMEKRFMLFLKSYHKIYPLKNDDFLLIPEMYRFFILNYVIKDGFRFFNKNIAQKLIKDSVNLYLPNIDKLVIDGSSYKGEADLNYMVGTWWNHEIVKAKAQISAISGRIIEQKVEFLGKKNIEVNGKNYEALHFKFLSSDETLPDNKKLNTDIWYDAKTFIWLKAQFIKQGNWEYRLKKLN